MVEEFIGYFTTTSKQGKPKTRFFILDSENASLHYFQDSSQLSMIIPNTENIQDMLALLETKTLTLERFKLSDKQHSSFTLTLKTETPQSFSIFAWENGNLEVLHESLKQLKARLKSNQEVQSSASEHEIADKAITIQLPNGNTYVGEVDEEGLPHSDAAKEFLEDGSVYYGSFRFGKRHGPGCFVGSKGETSYVEYIDGEKCGI